MIYDCPFGNYVYDLHYLNAQNLSKLTRLIRLLDFLFDLMLRGNS